MFTVKKNLLFFNFEQVNVSWEACTVVKLSPFIVDPFEKADVF